MSLYGIIYFFSVALFFGLLRHLLIRMEICNASLRTQNNMWIPYEITNLFLFSMTISAPLLYALLYRTTPSGLWGGYGIFILFIVPYLLFRRLPCTEVLDCVVLAVSAAMILAKLGCYHAGCCHGKVTDVAWAVQLDKSFSRGASKLVHPTQLYDAGLFLSAALAVWLLRVTGRLRGKHILIFLIIIGGGRFATEFYRGDMRRELLAGLTYTQVIAGLSAIIAASLILPISALRRVWSAVFGRVDPTEYHAQIEHSTVTLLQSLEPADRAFSIVPTHSRLRRALDLVGFLFGLFLLVIPYCSEVLIFVAIAVLLSKGRSNYRSLVRIEPLVSWLELCAVMRTALGIIFLWRVTTMPASMSAILGGNNLPAGWFREFGKQEAYWCFLIAAVCVVLAILLRRATRAYRAAHFATGSQ